MSRVPRRRFYFWEALGPGAAAVWAAVVLGGVFMTTRLVLAGMEWADLDHHAWTWVKTLWAGARFDALMALLLASPLLLLLTLLPEGLRQSAGFRRTAGAAYFGVLFAFLFLAVMEVAFFDEFSSRFNYIAVEYLLYPTEVGGNMWESYPVLWVLWGVALGAGGLFLATHRWFGRGVAAPGSPRVRWRTAGLVAALISLLTVLTPLRAMEVSGNRVQNEVAVNGFYTFFYALWSKDLSYPQFYRTLNPGESLARVNRLIRDRESRPAGSARATPLERVQAETGRLHRPNIVIFVEESFGANFTGVLGDHPEGLTPRFDRLAADGVLFTRFYATGSRTVRGLEAILCGFPPIPGESILKRTGSGHVFSLANILKGQGYDTLFVYGGRGIFDNMRPFMRDNGFDRFIEQKDFANPTFTTVWGVCDEDIFDRALAEFDAFQSRGRRFFATVLSVSNHKPYTYPAGRIDLDPRRRRREHAVKYADWALGRFFDQARTHAFFKDTVFVVIGDHGARVYGAGFIPIKSYEVPFLIYAPPLLKAARVDTLGSSLDVAPTLLGLTDISYPSVFFGRDLWDADPAMSYALLQHDRDVGILREDRLAVFGPDRSARVFRYDRRTRGFSPPLRTSPDDDLILDGVALYQTAYDLYKKHVYRPGGHGG